MELWDIYDYKREKIGKTMLRGVDLDDNERHLVVHICIFNSEDEMLIQQRKEDKVSWPDLWDLTVGGSAIEGENSNEAAHRELLEEIGVDISFDKIAPHLTINSKNSFDDVYIFRKDIDLSGLSLQTEEVKGVKWAKQEEILKLIDEGLFVPYFKSFINLLFELRPDYGKHIINR